MKEKQKQKKNIYICKRIPFPFLRTGMFSIQQGVYTYLPNSGQHINSGLFIFSPFAFLFFCVLKQMNLLTKFFFVFWPSSAQDQIILCSMIGMQFTPLKMWDPFTTQKSSLSALSLGDPIQLLMLSTNVFK